MTNFDFIGRSRTWLILTIVVFVIVIGSLSLKGLNFGIEFTGGNLLTVKSNQAVQTNEVRKLLKPLKLDKAIIQPVGSDSVMIRYGGQHGQDFKDQVIKAISAKYKVVDVQFEQVGPGWGSEITNAALWALVLSISALLIYISLRFEFKMAVTAVGALVHDVALTLGVYSLVGREVTPATIAALLTILGYSLYDTIVVFHKVTENSKKMSNKETYGRMVNRSLNQVLVRSLNTSITSVLPVLAILFFGGETLKDFAFALAIGMISGVYSSLIIASPLLVFWKEKEPHYRNLKRKYAGTPPTNSAKLATE